MTRYICPACGGKDLYRHYTCSVNLNCHTDSDVHDADPSLDDFCADCGWEGDADDECKDPDE